MQDRDIHIAIWDLLEQQHEAILREMVSAICQKIDIDPATASENLLRMVDKGVIDFSHKQGALAVKIVADKFRWRDTDSGLTPKGANYTTELV